MPEPLEDIPLTTTSTDIANDLQNVQIQIRDQERYHKKLFTAIFEENTLSRYEGISMLIKSGQQLEKLYRQEKALTKLRRTG